MPENKIIRIELSGDAAVAIILIAFFTFLTLVAIF
jgi:hypothetical protein